MPSLVIVLSDFWFYRVDKHTDRHTESHTDGANRCTHVTTVAVSKETKIENWLNSSESVKVWALERKSILLYKNHDVFIDIL